MVNNPSFNTRFIWLVSSVAALGGLLFGYDTAIISGAIPLIRVYFGLTDYGLGWAVGCILIGCGLGALLAGRFMEWKGRRYVLLVCAFLFALSGIGAGFAHSLWSFVLYRMVGGIGVGAAAMVSPIYIAEMAPAAWRGRLVSVYQLAIVSGILLAYAANYLLAGLGTESWRWMFASQALPALLFFLLLLGVPETPRWLVKKGKSDRAREILSRTGGAAFAVQALQDIQQSFSGESPTYTRDLFSRKYRPVLWAGLLIALFQQITGINAILYYAPVIFKETGVGSSNALLQTIGIGAVNLLTTFIAIGFVDRVGRKKFLLTGSIAMGISLVAVAACFHYQYFDHYLILLFTLIYVAAFGCTLGVVTWVYLSEIFPNSIRGLPMSAATLALWLADFLVTYTFPVISRQLGTSPTLLLYSVACAVAAVYIYFRIPETKGKTLEELENLFIKP